MKNILCIFMTICLIALCATACSRPVSQQEAPSGEPDFSIADDVTTEQKSKIGDKGYYTQGEYDNSLPDLHSFSGDTLDGGHFGSENFANYDITIINCWATYCGPCIDEMPQIAAYQKSLPSNVQLITYCIDGTDYFDEMVEILENADYTGITLVKGDGDLHSLYTELMYVPTTVFVDKEGNICAEPIIGASEDVAYTYQSVIDSILYG